MSAHKGGRGLKAPYESTHVRVPLPIKDKVQQIIDNYKDGISDDANQPISFDDAVEIAKKILRHKKSSRLSMQKLLKSIYGQNVIL